MTHAAVSPGSTDPDLRIDVTWIHPDLGLIDVQCEPTPDGARLEIRADDRILLDLPLMSDGPTRIQLDELADPHVRTGLQLGVLTSSRAEVEPLPEPPTRRYPPAWAVGAVWYQVFPDRFCNANAANDPTSPDTFQPAWNANWAEVSIEELEHARAADRAEGREANPKASPLHQVVYRRRYGGDLQGIVRRLPDIAALGATAIYLNPIFDSGSLHKYDARDHRHVDPTLGSPAGLYPPPEHENADPGTWQWTPADGYLTDTLVPEAHRNDLRIILDGVWNHVGLDHWAFRDVMQRGKASEYAEWFRVRFAEDRSDPGHVAGQVVAWTGWDGPNGHLPEFRQTEDADLVPPVKQHVADLTRRWMAPRAGHAIDGWRLDVVPDIGLAFWRDWNALVRSINPDAITIAEVWFRADDYLGGDVFDAQMNYPLRGAILPWLAGDVDAQTLIRQLEKALAFDDRVNLVQMNLLGSHDTARAVSQIAADRHSVATHERPTRADYELLLIGAALQVALPGSPSIYNGDEWGTFGGNDPDDRKPVPWPDTGPYDDATAPLGWVRDAFAATFRLRSEESVGPILRYGSWRLVAPAPDVFMVERRLNGRRVLVVANRADTPLDISDLVAGMAPVAAVTSVTSASRTLSPRSVSFWTDR